MCTAAAGGWEGGGWDWILIVLFFEENSPIVAGMKPMLKLNGKECVA